MTSEAEPALQQTLRAALEGSPLFAALPPERILQLAPTPQTLAEGETLFRQGEEGSCAFLVLSGILGLHSGNPEPAGTGLRFFRKAVAGELVGEYGPLCGEPRSAGAVALTPVELLRFDGTQLTALLQSDAAVQQQCLRKLAAEASQGREPARPPLDTIVIHDASPGSALTAQAWQQLTALLAAPPPHRAAADDEPLTVVDLAAAQASGSATDPEAALNAELVAAGRRGGRRLILSRDPRAISPRNRLLIDRLLLLSDGQAERIQLPEPLSGEVLLLRLWPLTQQQPFSQPWALAYPFAQILNIRPEQPEHAQRLLRAVLRRQHALVLGGGGARGFAHIGALAAMEELGLQDFDLVLGVSIGSLVATLLAFGHPAARILQELERVIIRARPYTFTLPRRSLFSLEPSRRALAAFFGDRQLQDGWLGLRCHSTNLSTNRHQAWLCGDIATAVIASMSVPGIFPAVVDGAGQRHVDGGILNNLPIGAARRCSDGRVVAISLDPDPNSQPDPNDQPAPAGASSAATGAGLGRTIIDALMCGSHAAGQAEERLADVLLRPDILRFPFLDWSQYREIHGEGYRAARQRLEHGWPAG